MNKLLFALLLWLTMPVATPATAQGSDGFAAVTLSFKPVPDSQAGSYHLVVMGHFNGNSAKSFSFLYDTGANYSVITDTTARSLHLLVRPVTADTDLYAIKKGRAAYFADVPAFTMQTDHLFEPVSVDGRFAVFSDQQFASVGTPINGTIGSDFWARFGQVFDFAKCQITLFRPAEVNPARLLELGFAAAAPVPLSSDAFGVASLTIHLRQGKQGAEQTIILDTGSTYTVISYQTAMRLGLKPAGSGIRVSSAFNDYRLNSAVVDTLQIGDIVQHNVTVHYPERDGAEIAGFTLGMDILQHYKMLLSVSDKKVYLLPAQTAPIVTVGPFPAPPAK